MQQLWMRMEVLNDQLVPGCSLRRSSAVPQVTRVHHRGRSDAGLAIGANAVVFSVLNGLILRPLNALPSGKIVPLPAINVTARRVTVRAKQERRPPAVAGQHPPHDTQNRGALIGSLQFHMAPRVVRYTARQPHNFHDFAVVPFVLPHQQIWDVARIIELASHKPGRDDGHVLAVEPRPRANKVLMPAAGLFSWYKIFGGRCVARANCGANARLFRSRSCFECRGK